MKCDRTSAGEPQASVKLGASAATGGAPYARPIVTKLLVGATSSKINWTFEYTGSTIGGATEALGS